MSKNWTPSKPTVELDGASPPPSRIRRQASPKSVWERGKTPWWATREWEIRLGIIGMVVFAIAINAVLFGVSQTLGQ